ncbi:putative transposase [Vigna unguiculata]|uniref:Putative transposase n=1 Tax=Vigna unguiculata TaxID=3917 RepID=A0A4D6LMG5_VIGUN|nr:putative transposase [Vigna unguiculata]
MTSRLPSSCPTTTLIHEEFENRLSQVRSEQGSCVGPSDPNVDPTTEDTIRTQCWVEVVGGKNKGRVYGVGQLAANSCASGSLRHQPSSSSSSAEDVTYLRQRVEAHDQAYEELKGQFQNLHNLVLTLLPPDHRALQQPQSNEEFENRLSQVRSEQGSCVGPSDPNVDPTTEDTIRTQCWVEVVGGKNKGRVYGVGQLAANSCASGSLRHQPSSSSSSAEDVTYLRQRVEAHDQAYEELKGQFQNLHNLVLTLLPPDHRALQQPQSNFD